MQYFIKRGHKVQGPISHAQLMALAKQMKLKKSDLISNSKDGPWLNITKEPLQQMQQGRDIEIKSPEEWLTIPPKNRDELKEWLQANKNESVVVCPFCGVSVKRKNLLKHCDKLCYSRLSTTNSSLPASQAATKKSAGKSKNPKVSVTRHPKNVEELESPLPPDPPTAYETTRGFFSKTLKVKYKCPVCSIKLTNSLAEAGENDSCPECHATFIVPGNKERKERQKQLKEKRDQALEELAKPITSLGRGNAKKKQTSIYGFEKQAHITDAPSTAMKLPTELPRSSESSVVSGCVGLFVLLIIGSFVAFIGIPILSAIFDITEDTGAGFELADIAILMMYTGGAMFALLPALPAIAIGMGPLWIIIFLLMDNNRATRDPDSPSLFGQIITWVAFISLLGGPIVFVLGVVLYFVARLFGSEPALFG